MSSNLEHRTMNLPRSQDEAFRAGLRGAPFCDVDNYEVAMITQGTTPHVPSHPTLFVIVDFIGPHQEKFLPTTYWAYDESLELEECYRIGRVLRFIFWLFDLVGLSDDRSLTIGGNLMHAAKAQVTAHKAGTMDDRYDSSKLITHFIRLLKKITDFDSIGKTHDQIAEDLQKYAHRIIETKNEGPFAITVESGESFKKWTPKPNPDAE